MNTELERILASSKSGLGDNDWQFLNRVYRQDQAVYSNRLKALGFTRHDRVLDAGCGFGQWSMALARLNNQVAGIDTADVRIKLAGNIAAALNLDNVLFKQAGLDRIPFDDEEFDAVFCYGVLFLTDFEKSLREFYRTLKPEGRLYVNANGLGWFVHLWLNSPNKASDHDPRQTVVDAFSNTLKYKIGHGRTDGHVMLEHSELTQILTHCGFSGIQVAGEGCLNVTEGTDEKVSIAPFFQSKYEGLTGVFEALAHKIIEN